MEYINPEFEKIDLIDFSKSFFQKIEKGFSLKFIQDSIFKINLSIIEKNRNLQKIQFKLKKQIDEKRDGSIRNPKIFIIKITEKSKILNYVTMIYYLYSKSFPLREQILICNSNTKPEDIINFFSIYKYYNEIQENNGSFSLLFSIIHADRLSQKCQNILISETNSIDFFTKIPMIIFEFYQKQEKTFLSSLLQEGKLNIDFEDEINKNLKQIIKCSPIYHQIHVFYSNFTGEGKSFQIRKFCFDFKRKTNNYKYQIIQLNKGTISEMISKLNQITNQLKEKEKEKETIFIHIEFPNKCSIEISDAIWQLTMWGSIENSNPKSSKSLCWNIQSNIILLFEIPNKQEKYQKSKSKSKSKSK
ncbi:hypothetical protein M0811_11554 [Anaeramoeba ignava]|uniref:Uncharacterized protein n=1 Tax=Anaeramoeba ignava TaxID=1746090 RepID=A0A9Q0LD74_ANAIG|nr:hypothetical protein M0811_11554 [Anaeramoeba ignava]